MKSDRKREFLRIINNRGLNIAAILIATTIALIKAWRFSLNLPGSANMGGLALLLLIPILGLIVLISYLILRKPLNEFSWIITVIGIIYLIYKSTDI
ncbi:hypothetical protein [Salinimicrobium gaetbulicola]|uniref:Uncharacterized protein n=1 Tax=Salinimicrobium gaetbulicola TaxID=999702 RepID=A0ABW3IFE8_9FLAO